MTSNYYIGIDLGKSGGISCINNGEILGQYSMPITEETIIAMLFGYVKSLLKIDKYAIIKFVMEKTSPRPNEGVVSVSTFARHCGGVYYTCLLLSMLYVNNVLLPIRIAPATWKKHFELLDSKLSKYDKKKLSVDYVNKRFGQSLTYNKNGIADAILIALYSYEGDVNDKTNI